MRWFLVLATVASLTACKKDPPPAPVPVAVKPVLSEAERARAFWAWVASHVDALKAVKTGHEPVTAQLAAELEKVEPGLVFELGLGREPFELIISADGETKWFPAVKRLVASAGPIPGVKVIAFRPRKDVDGFSMDVGERKLAGSELWFVAKADREHPGRVAVEIYVEHLDDAQAEQLKTGAFMLLEAAVGEFDLETKIGTIDIMAAAEKPELPLKKLKELPATLDAWK